MKTSLLIGALALAWIGAASRASAYSFNPPDASVRLHGTLTFTPDENNGKPFTCGVTMELKTKPSEIKTVKFDHGSCGVGFGQFPWSVGILNANSGEFVGGSFGSGNGVCVEAFNQFQVNGSGIWTLPAGECLSGTLTSHPPTTIVP